MTDVPRIATPGAPPGSDGSRRAAAIDALRAGDSPILRCFPHGAIIVFDHDLRYLSAGGLGLADVGLSREMLEGRTVGEVFPPAVVDVIEPVYRSALAGVESTMDVPYQDRIYLMRLGPLRDTDGVVIAGMGFTQDVTEARQAELALRESENRFRSAFEYAPIGKALIGLDGRYQQVNAAMCRLTGYTDEQLLGLCVADVTHPDDMAADVAVSDRLLAGELITHTLEKRYLTATGTTVWAAKSVSLVRRDDGSPLHFIAQIQDVTDRITGEQLLAKERRRLREAQSIGHVGSWEMDVTVGEVSWSDTLFTLYGLDPKLFAGDYQAALDVIHPEDRAVVDAATRACIETGEPLRVRYRVTRVDDGQLRWFDARGEALYEQGQLVRLAGAVADVTDLIVAESEAKEARDAALDASRHKSSFLATMSHEIRTPMNAVIGLTGLLLDTDLDHQQRDFVETVRNSGEALLVIINDILDFSKIESGGLELEIRPFNLWECVEESLELLGSVADEKGLDLVGYVHRSPQWVIGDAARLRQVLVNLVSNAIKFTAQGDVLLEVIPGDVTDHDVRLNFSVTDTGIGIPAERLGQLFDAFSQVDASTTRVYGGTGLGLTISQRLIKAMGGQIEVTSEVGKGSSFSFSIMLPRGDAADSQISGRVEDLRGTTALVVDDNATHLRILQLQLRGWGMECVTAASADAALALNAGGARFDLAVIDMNMPGMNGVDLAARLHGSPNGAGLPIVLLASLGALVERDGSTDFAAVLTKPVKCLALQEALAASLAPAAATLTVPSHRRPVRPGTSPGVRLRVLLAEDNIVNQKVATLMLHKLGHHVDVVANGAEAVESVGRIPYDIVLMDVEMPEMDGLEATRMIRRDLPTAQQPLIVALTASALVSDRQACIEAGMNDYLAKPVRLADLGRALNRVGAVSVRRHAGRPPAR